MRAQDAGGRDFLRQRDYRSELCAGHRRAHVRRMDKSSTAENPVVLVQIGSGENRRDQLIHVNEVAPDGAWQTYNSLRNRLEETEQVDNVAGKGNYDSLRVNWLELIQQAIEDELLRQKGWFAESFFMEELGRLYNELDAMRPEHPHEN